MLHNAVEWAQGISIKCYSSSVDDRSDEQNIIICLWVMWLCVQNHICTCRIFRGIQGKPAAPEWWSLWWQKQYSTVRTSLTYILLSASLTGKWIKYERFMFLGLVRRSQIFQREKMERDRRVNDRQQLPTTGIHHGGEHKYKCCTNIVSVLNIFP